jgi:hypothetical protein
MAAADVDLGRLRKAFEELPSGDLTLIEALLSQDVLWLADDSTGGPPSKYHGRLETMAMIRANLGALADLELGEVRQARDGVVVEFKSKSLPTGHTFRLLTVTDGNIVQMRVFLGEEAALGEAHEPELGERSADIGLGSGGWDDTGAEGDRSSTFNHPGDGGPG